MTSPTRGTVPARIGLRALAALCILVLAAGAGHLLWRAAWPRLKSDARYELAVEDIVVSPPPAWLQADVRAEALRNSGLEGPLSVLDDELCPKLARAFAMHPWVAKVVRVSKSSRPGVEIELVYREPVCMVEVPGGLVPVDVEGVVLPTADFAGRDFQVRRYPRLAGAAAGPGPDGVVWPDKVVAGGARVAAALLPLWSRCKLARIAPLRRQGPIVFELVTETGARIAWGSAPGEEESTEPSAAEKLARLSAYHEEHGSVDGAALDVRL